SATPLCTGARPLNRTWASFRALATKFIVRFPSVLRCLPKNSSCFPEGCFVLVDNERAVGYGLSHPWLLAACRLLTLSWGSFLGLRNACLFTMSSYRLAPADMELRTI